MFLTQFTDASYKIAAAGGLKTEEEGGGRTGAATADHYKAILAQFKTSRDLAYK